MSMGNLLYLILKMELPLFILMTLALNLLHLILKMELPMFILMTMFSLILKGDLMFLSMVNLLHLILKMDLPMFILMTLSLKGKMI